MLDNKILTVELCFKVGVKLSRPVIPFIHCLYVSIATYSLT